MKIVAGFGALVGIVVLAACSALAAEEASIEPAADADVLSFVVEGIEGEEVDLERYRGKVVLIVNTASECGLTPQYAGLQSLYETYEDEGFVVLGFPSNDFMGQEPGSEAEILEFCTGEYGVTFPMFSKVKVRGEEKHPLYAKLTGQPDPVGGAVQWNFQKYLVDRSGNVVAMYSPRVAPGAEEVRERVEGLLAAGG